MRVIAGSLRGRTLVAPEGSTTRPTTDRVREALFSVLGSVTGLVVLDLYAGTGALGIEALSRGASRAVFVEPSRQALLCLQQNITALALSAQSTILKVPAEKAITRLVLEGPFDLVFCDPPWLSLPATFALLAKLDGAHWLTEEARVVVEHPRKQSVTPQLPPSLTPVFERHWGDTAVSILGRTRE